MWLVFALPTTAVIGGFVTLVIAMSTDDGLVVDDYYRRGLAINRVLARDRAATTHGLSGRIEIYPDSGRARLFLQADEQMQTASVVVTMHHATRAGHDRTLELTRSGPGLYQGALNDGGVAPGHWTLEVSAGEWRLLGRLYWPLSTVAKLEAQLTPEGLGSS